MLAGGSKLLKDAAYGMQYPIFNGTLLSRGKAKSTGNNTFWWLCVVSNADSSYYGIIQDDGQIGLDTSPHGVPICFRIA